MAQQHQAMVPNPLAGLTQALQQAHSTLSQQLASGVRDLQQRFGRCGRPRARADRSHHLLAAASSSRVEMRVAEGSEEGAARRRPQEQGAAHPHAVHLNRRRVVVPPRPAPIAAIIPGDSVGEAVLTTGLLNL